VSAKLKGMLTSILHSQRSRWTTFGVLLIAISIGGSGPGLSKAFAQGKAAPDPDRQLRELEQRVKILELENETLDRRLQLEIDRNLHLFDDVDKRLRAVESRAPENRDPDPCRDPYIHIAPGILRVKPGCESAGGECTAPEAVDARGVRIVLPGCRQTVVEGARQCDPPYFVDESGVKRFKPGCL
jgi:hypothetical protein